MGVMSSRHPFSSEFKIAFAALSIVSMLPLWLVKYLPMFDLSQHAVQLAILKNIHNPAFGFEGLFSFHWFAPYLADLAAGQLFSLIVGPFVAVKLTVSLAVLLLPFSLAVLFRESGGDEWWALLGFPFAYNLNFYWGFLGFIFAVPFGILVMAYVFEYAEHPDLRKGIFLSAGMVALFFLHFFVYGITSVLVGVYLVFSRSTWNKKGLPLIPVVAAVPLAAIWFLSGPVSVEGSRYAPMGFSVMSDFLVRVVVFWSHLIGAGSSPEHSILGFTVFLFPISWGSRLRTSPPRLAVLICALLLYFLLPVSYLRSAGLPGRVVLFVVAAVYLNREADPVRYAPTLRIFFCAIIAGSMVLLTLWFKKFDEKARGIDAVIAAIPPKQHVLGLVFKDTCQDSLPARFVHAAPWIQVEKGGIVERSFTNLGYPMVVRRTSPQSQVRDAYLDGLMWMPEMFVWEKNREFDFYSVYDKDGKHERLFSNKRGLVLRLKENDWYLYENAAKRRSQS